MKLTLNWLKQFLATNASLDDITKALTMIGLEVEEVIDSTATFKDFIVAEVVSTTPHPNANKLQLCSVNTGTKILQIVCGAANVRAGLKIVLALPGAIIPSNGLTIIQTTIRGILSEGMICSEQELAISNNSSGIMELDDDVVVGQSFSTSFGYDDPLIHINVTPNRGDCLGVYGVARDLAAKKMGKLKPLDHLLIRNISASSNSPINIAESSLQHIPLLIATAVKNIDNSCQTPLWMRNLLHRVGINIVSPIVDITNYICYSFGYPIHAYDQGKLGNDIIEVRKAQQDEQIIALNNKTYTLSADDLVISSNNTAISIAGIIGGINSSCSPQTTDIVLETGYFLPSNIITTGRRLNIDTDARFRFERNVDYNMAVQVHNMALNLISSICGGNIAPSTIVGEIKIPSRKIDFPIIELKKKTGIDLDVALILKILVNLGFRVFNSNDMENNILHLEIPSWRSDITIVEDIVEELLRIHGYNHLPEIPIPYNQLPSVTLLPNQEKSLIIKRIAAACGYNEVVTWSFMNSNLVHYFDTYKDELHVVNPISSELNYMRPTIVPNLLEVIAKNQARAMKSLAFFEVGPIFTGVQPKDEKPMFAAIKCGDKELLHPHNEISSWDLFDIKADLEIILTEFGINLDDYHIDSTYTKEYYHPGRFGQILVDKVIIGWFGEIHPRLLAKFDCQWDRKSRVIAIEIDVNSLPLPKRQHIIHRPIKLSNYPHVERDFAFIVDQNVQSATIVDFIKKIDQDLIKSVVVFDVYISDKLPQNKKSIALRITIQSCTQTLSEQLITETSDNIVSAVQKQFDAILRDT